jgi:protein-disulfide isomerase
MKRLVLLSLVLAAAGCERPISKLDQSPGGKVPSGDVETRLRRLEENLARREEALAFLEQAYKQQKAAMEAEAESEPAPDAIFAVDIEKNLKAGMVEGSPSAPITIVKAFDFACPYCQNVNTTLESLLKKYEGKVRVVYKNFVVHPDAAMPAHLASCAAAKQGKYVAFKNAFWEKGFTPYLESRGQDRASMGEENILKIAGGIGLDTNRFKTDMASEDCKTTIRDDMAELEKFKVGSTPTCVPLTNSVGGALSEGAFTKLVEDKLSVVASSGVSGPDYYNKELMGKGEKKVRSR